MLATRCVDVFISHMSTRAHFVLLIVYTSIKIFTSLFNAPRTVQCLTEYTFSAYNHYIDWEAFKFIHYN